MVVVRMMTWLEQTSFMPKILKFAVILAVLSPFLVAGSVVSGTIAQPGISVSRYGAAANVFELFLVVLATAPAWVGSALVFVRQRFARVIFPLGMLSAYLAPLVLSTVREQLDYMVSFLFSALVLTFFLYGYFFLSKDVKQYFSKDSIT